MFVIDAQYTRKDIFQLIGVPPNTRGGKWDTGYFTHNNDYYLFVNIGIAGRTGHNYNNEFKGDLLHWVAKNNTKISHPTIQRLLHPAGFVYIFYRTDSRSPFMYAGTGIPIDYQATIPVRVTWKILGYYNDHYDTVFEPGILLEGSARELTSVSYERNPQARCICIQSKGYRCCVCNFDFEQVYGNLGCNYIQVHHITPISSSGTAHAVDPYTDLVPICANCHAMIHRRNPPLTIQELRGLLHKAINR